MKIATREQLAHLSEPQRRDIAAEIKEARLRDKSNKLIAKRRLETHKRRAEVEFNREIAQLDRLDFDELDNILHYQAKY